MLGSETPASLSERAADLKLTTMRRHIFLCADQTKPKCCAREAGIEGLGLSQAPPEGTGIARRRVPYARQLPAHLRERTDCAGLSRGRLVSQRRAGGARAHHPGTPDRGADRRRPRVCAQPGLRRFGVYSSAAASGGSNESNSSGFRAKRFKTRMMSPLRKPARDRRR
jgi:hypothetical protein